jgi:hypothetical protein
MVCDWFDEVLRMKTVSLTEKYPLCKETSVRGGGKKETLPKPFEPMSSSESSREKMREKLAARLAESEERQRLAALLAAPQKTHTQQELHDKLLLDEEPEFPSLATPKSVAMDEMDDENVEEATMPWERTVSETLAGKKRALDEEEEEEEGADMEIDDATSQTSQTSGTSETSETSDDVVVVDDAPFWLDDKRKRDLYLGFVRKQIREISAGQNEGNPFNNVQFLPLREWRFKEDLTDVNDIIINAFVAERKDPTPFMEKMDI